MADTSTVHASAGLGWIARLDAWFYRRHQRAVEHYLASSQNLAELESRMRELDRPVR